MWENEKGYAQLTLLVFLPASSSITTSSTWSLLKWPKEGSLQKNTQEAYVTQPAWWQVMMKLIYSVDIPGPLQKINSIDI